MLSTKSGLPLSDWHAALRNWKDFQGTQKTPEQAETDSQLELLLPMLLKKTAELAKQKEKLVFHDPHIGTVLQFYGFDRFDYNFNVFEVHEMVKKYATSKKLGTGCPQMRSPNPYGKGTLQVPTIEEFAAYSRRKKVIKPKADFLHREKFNGRMQNPASFFVSRIVKNSKTCPHQMSAPQFSIKIQNAFNGQKTPIHKKKCLTKSETSFSAK